MWWVTRIPKHLPFSPGNFVPGCVDVMLGYTREDPFMRLFYPTNSEYNEKVNHKKWIPWIEDDNYLVGIAKVIKVPIIILRLVFWWCTNLHVPVLYGEKPRTEDKLKCIIMSHGLGGNRFLYSKVCCDLASQGFLVACLEHRDNSASYTYYYDSDEKAELDDRTVIEFQHIPFGQKHYQSRNSQIKVRASECCKIMDVLKNLNEGSIPHNVLKPVHRKKSIDFDLKELIGKIDTENFTLMGHSFGAATALYTSSLRDDVRLSRCTFNYLHELIQEDLVRRVPGCPTIPSRHQLMIALWKMTTTDSYRQCILLDPWMFPIKDEKLEDRVKFPVLFLNTQTFHIESNVKAMAKFLTNDTVKMYTILGTTHENQTDSVLAVGYWLNWLMKKIDPHLALKINNALILTFLHSCMKIPVDIQESEQFLETTKEFYEEGLTKPWL